MKKLNKFFAVLVALAMMATLCVMSAFAADPKENKDLEHAYLVKYLAIPSGVDIPDETYTFTFTPKEGSSEEESAPPIGSKTIATSAMTPSASTTDGNSQVGKIDLAFLEDLDYPHAGVYQYTVKETPGSVENETYSPDQYTLTVYVTNQANNDGTTTPKVDGITVSDDNKTPGDDGNGGKVDTTDTDPSDEADTTGEDEKPNDDGTVEDTNASGYEGFNFLNKLANPNTDPFDPENPNKDKAALNVSKKVTGDFANKEVDTFEFAIEFGNQGKNADELLAYLYDGTKATKVMLDMTKANQFALKDGQYLAIPELPGGVTYKVTEKLATGDLTVTGPSTSKGEYQATYTATRETTPNTAEKGKDLATATDTHTKGAKEAVAYTNDYNDESVTPTGILISNLPYIALALVAIGGLVAYVVVRRRNADEA